MATPSSPQPTAKTKFVPGQRWVSESEPELGLGIVLEAGFRDVKISFPAADTVRTYAHRSAPLRRVRLKPGDRARSRVGGVLTVCNVSENAGLLTYLGDGGSPPLPEGELLDRMAFSDPDKRLLAGQADKPRAFALRYRTHLLRRDMLASRVRGLAGARVELLEHQIHIAHEAASRHDARILLADEVGLGKTIEAGLLFHRLYVTGQISRVLIVTPPQLAHQWLLEMYRKFNHMFTVLDEDLCRSEEKGDKSVNSFANRQTAICSLDFLTASPRRAAQAAEAGIDLLIVDEAHHLAWSSEAASPEYAAVEILARAARKVALLTATPVQLGQSGHFARLRLLDPGRFTDLDAYRNETARYGDLARAADAILSSEAPSRETADILKAAFPADTALQAGLSEYLAEKPGARQKLIDDLIDRHGTGRLMFRNRRAALGGFPRRVVHAVPLADVSGRREFARALALAAAPTDSSPADGIGFLRDEADLARFLNGPAAYTSSDLGHAEGAAEFLDRARRQDPRLDWLIALLKQHAEEKILLICSRKAVVFALQEMLPTLTTATFALFHENLSMATRDKHAAYFSRPDGAQMLICSEIGSEGRNFQFAHHLVLFDLPLDPSVLEQRIGRLDRIGQKSDIHIHVPYVQGTVHEVIYRWYQDGMDAFRRPVLGSDYFHAEQIGEVLELCRLVARVEASPPPPPALDEALAELLERTQALSQRMRETLEQGRDRLLELQSNRPESARALIAEIRAADADLGLEEYLEDVFDHFGVDSESTAAARGYFLFPGERMEMDAFPELPPAGLAITYDRAEALVREDLAFLSLDHPLTRAAVDLVLDGGAGATGFVEWRGAPVRGMALDAVFVLEAAAPGFLHIDRFLAPAPLRVLIDSAGTDISHLLTRLDAGEIEQAPMGLLEERHAELESLVPELLNAAMRTAVARETPLKREARREAETRLGAERDRLRALRTVNPAISEKEAEEADRFLRETLKHIDAAVLRLDALRLVLLKP